MALRQFASPRLSSAFAAVRTSTVAHKVKSSAPGSASAPVVPNSQFHRIKSGNVAVTTGVNSASQVRYAHLDVPNFDAVKRDSKPDDKEADYSRRAFTYLMGASGAIATAHLAKSMVQDFLDTMSASADVLALAKMEVDLTAIPVGKNVTFKWRGKPVFVRHRPADEIQEVRAVDATSLRHPEKDEERVTKDEWLVVLGICTHLGCVPIANAGEFGGYFCPCHGSHYDASGRIRKGPAPTNLEIPEHSFVEDDTKLIIG